MNHFFFYSKFILDKKNSFLYRVYLNAIFNLIIIDKLLIQKSNFYVNYVFSTELVFNEIFHFTLPI